MAGSMMAQDRDAMASLARTIADEMAGLWSVESTPDPEDAACDAILQSNKVGVVSNTGKDISVVVSAAPRIKLKNWPGKHQREHSSLCWNEGDAPKLKSRHNRVQSMPAMHSSSRGRVFHTQQRPPALNPNATATAGHWGGRRPHPQSARGRRPSPNQNYGNGNRGNAGRPTPKYAGAPSWAQPQPHERPSTASLYLPNHPKPQSPPIVPPNSTRNSAWNFAPPNTSRNSAWNTTIVQPPPPPPLNSTRSNRGGCGAQQQRPSSTRSCPQAPPRLQQFSAAVNGRPAPRSAPQRGAAPAPNRTANWSELVWDHEHAQPGAPAPPESPWRKAMKNGPPTNTPTVAGWDRSNGPGYTPLGMSFGSLMSPKVGGKLRTPRGGQQGGFYRSPNKSSRRSRTIPSPKKAHLNPKAPAFTPKFGGQAKLAAKSLPHPHHRPNAFSFDENAYAKDAEAFVRDEEVALPPQLRNGTNDHSRSHTTELTRTESGTFRVVGDGIWEPVSKRTTSIDPLEGELFARILRDVENEAKEEMFDSWCKHRRARSCLTTAISHAIKRDGQAVE